MKKVFYLSISVVAGIVLSFNVEKASANIGLEQDPGVSSGIPCWSSGSVNPLFRYVDCGSCISKTGSPSGGKGTCKS